jgi:hypothetical protein
MFSSQKFRRIATITFIMKRLLVKDFLALPFRAAQKVQVSLK